MDREMKGLAFEIVLLTLLLIVIVPICVNASSEYRRQKAVLLDGVGTSVNITNKGDMKKVTIYSNYDKIVRVNLVMKIGRFLNDYEIYLDGCIYNINDLEYFDDGEYKYFKLGIYEVYQYREFDFKLNVIGNVYYEEAITYSFMTEGLL